MRPPTRSRSWAAVIAIAALLLTGCAGVPTSSKPQVVSRLTGGVQAPSPASTPLPGSDPRTIVQGFLENNPSSDQHHTAARAFLTGDTASRWSDSNATVIDRERVEQFVPDTNTVTVTGFPVGTVNADGIYTPNVSAPAQPSEYVFGLRSQGGQWRISSLPSGVLLTTAQFGSYSALPLYFYDLDQRYLVQDQRYTSITGTSALVTWLINEMVAGPRDELQNAVLTEVPSQVDPRAVSVTVGTTIDITMPGVAGVGRSTLNLLAAQIAYTLRAVAATTAIRIIDGRPLTVPALRRTDFSAPQFAGPEVPDQVGTAYYLHNGRLYSSGEPVRGRVGNGSYFLSSVAVAGIASVTTLRVAGTIKEAAGTRLWVGTQTGGLSPTSILGVLSRPTWAPGRNEVWIADNGALWAVDPGTVVSQVSLEPESGGRMEGTVDAVRFSPDGVRIALIVSTPDGNTQVWVGSVVRSGNSVSVEGLEPVTPEGVTMVDVGWNGPLTLIAVGRVGTTDDGSLYSLRVDGSLLSSDAITGLPTAPDNIAVSTGAPVIVSAGGAVWQQSGGSEWSSPDPAGETTGTSPVYQE